VIRAYYDVVIVGAGIAGTIAALQTAKLRADLSILVVSKGELHECSSQLAQGGIALPHTNSAEDLEQHLMDTLVAGNMDCSVHAVQAILAYAPVLIEYLEQYGVAFDRVSDNCFHYALEGGHSRPRIVHVADATGATIMAALHAALVSTSNIDVAEGYRLVRLQQVTNALWNLTLYQSSMHTEYLVEAGQIVLAMGGSGSAFGFTSNMTSSLGDSIGVVGGIDVEIRDLQWMQFHPTVMITAEGNAGMPLVTEALRGVGAHLLNAHGERFMSRYHMQGELAPRDVVTKAMHLEIETTGIDNVFLDCRHVPTDTLQTYFPSFIATCARLNLNPSMECIPVRPGAHYQCGGIVAGVDGATSVKGLSVVGECACTGMHGSNRLASNSLLEAGVMALKAAARIASGSAHRGGGTESAQFIVTQCEADSSIAHERISNLLEELRAHLHNIATCNHEERVEQSVQDLISKIVAEVASYPGLGDVVYDARTLVSYATAYLFDRATKMNQPPQLLG